MVLAVRLIAESRTAASLDHPIPIHTLTGRVPFPAVYRSITSIF